MPFEVREEARLGLQDWWADRIDTWVMNQLSGNTAETNTKYSGNQAPIAPSSAAGNTRIIYADGGSTSEASLSAVQKFQLSFIDKAVVTAKTATPLIRPVRVQGGEFYVAFLHPWQVFDLRTDATAGRITWYDAQKARVQGGLTGEAESPIFSGALGLYNGVVLHESTRLPAAPTNANVRRALLCGAQGGAFAFGQGNQPAKMDWFEELFDSGDGSAAA